ncbi:uncharacterized protein LOC144121828 [Amblyomma americanum]
MHRRAASLAELPLDCESLATEAACTGERQASQSGHWIASRWPPRLHAPERGKPGRAATGLRVLGNRGCMHRRAASLAERPLDCESFATEAACTGERQASQSGHWIASPWPPRLHAPESGNPGRAATGLRVLGNRGCMHRRAASLAEKPPDCEFQATEAACTGERQAWQSRHWTASPWPPRLHVPERSKPGRAVSREPSAHRPPRCFDGEGFSAEGPDSALQRTGSCRSLSAVPPTSTCTMVISRKAPSAAPVTSSTTAATGLAVRQKRGRLGRSGRGSKHGCFGCAAASAFTRAIASHQDALHPFHDNLIPAFLKMQGVWTWLVLTS